MLSRVTRLGRSASRLHVARGASYSVWDRVHPSFWHPMATLEQSMMELDRVTSQMISAPFHFAQMIDPRTHSDDDDFFKDLTAPSSSKEGKNTEHASDKEAAKGEKKKTAGNNSYSSYSYSSSTILDERGRRVTSVRRRYEDSMGRLKAVHEREIDGKKVKTTWQRKLKGQDGDHKTLTEATTVDEFEEEWKKTPFGKAEGQRQVAGEVDAKPEGVVQCEKEAEKVTPGPDYEAAEKAPDKEDEAQGVTKEAKSRSRDEAIAQGSKTQEEETTPPKYTSGAPGYS